MMTGVQVDHVVSSKGGGVFLPLSQPLAAASNMCSVQEATCVYNIQGFASEVRAYVQCYKVYSGWPTPYKVHECQHLPILECVRTWPASSPSEPPQNRPRTLGGYISRAAPWARARDTRHYPKEG